MIRVGIPYAADLVVPGDFGDAGGIMRTAGCRIPPEFADQMTPGVRIFVLTLSAEIDHLHAELRLRRPPVGH